MTAIEVALVRTVKAGVIRRGIQPAFVRRLIRVGKRARFVVIASPWISTLRGEAHSLDKLARHLKRLNVPAYIFTRQPETTDHLEAVQTLLSCPSVELLYNQNL